MLKTKRRLNICLETNNQFWSRIQKQKGARDGVPVVSEAKKEEGNLEIFQF